MESVKIPQDITIEDRIIGPITLRQLFLMLGGGGVSYALWTIFKRAGYIGVAPAVIALIPLFITAAFAFVKISGISLLRFLFLLAEMLVKPPVRTWQPRQGIWVDPGKFTLKHSTRNAKGTAQPKHADSIEELTSLLDGNLLGPSQGQTSLPAGQASAQGVQNAVDTITVESPETLQPPVVRDIQPPIHG